MSEAGIVVADKLSPALIETPEQGVKFVKIFRAAVEAARTVGAERSVTNKYAEKLVRSVRVTGGLIAELPRVTAGRKKKGAEIEPTHWLNFLGESGISPSTAKNWQLVAAIPESEFEQRIAELRDSADPNIFITLSPFYGIHNHRAQGTGENEWYTPVEYLKLARAALGEIDLDPASSEEAQRHVQAKAYLSKADDGLAHEWIGRIWLNPPYAQPYIAEFVSKLVAERQAGRVSAAILLTHNYTDTAWFHEAAAVADAICFTLGRVKFYEAHQHEFDELRGLFSRRAGRADDSARP